MQIMIIKINARTKYINNITLNALYNKETFELTSTIHGTKKQLYCIGGKSDIFTKSKAPSIFLFSRKVTKLKNNVTQINLCCSIVIFQ